MYFETNSAIVVGLLIVFFVWFRSLLKHERSLPIVLIMIAFTVFISIRLFPLYTYSYYSNNINSYTASYFPCENFISMYNTYQLSATKELIHIGHLYVIKLILLDFSCAVVAGAGVAFKSSKTKKSTVVILACFCVILLLNMFLYHNMYISHMNYYDTSEILIITIGILIGVCVGRILKINRS